MMLAELVKFNSSWMKLMSSFGIRMNDYQYLKLYNDYLQMVRNGEKKEYIYAVLKERYGIPKRTIQRIVKRMRNIV